MNEHTDAEALTLSPIAADAMPLAWRRALLPLALLLVAVVLAFRGTLADMIGIWSRSDTFAHAFLVAPISLWLIWRRRADLARVDPRPSLPVLLVFAAAALAWGLGELVVVNAVTQLAAVAMLVLAVPAVLGLRVAGVILFPLAFLFFSVPIGEFLLPTLIGWTADFTVAALRLSGVPVLREGNQFVIPTGHWSVVEACSGVRYLIASLMVGSLFAYLNYRSWQRRATFAVFALLVPIVANWVRAYMIVMLGHLSGNTVAVGVDHLIYGWVFFGVVILLLFMIGARWSEPDADLVPSQLASRTSLPASGAAASWAVAITGIILAAAPLAMLAAIERAEPRGPVSLEPALEPAPPWVADGSALVVWKPEFQNPSAAASQAYRHGEQWVGSHLLYYRQQGPNNKLVSSTNVLVKSSDLSWNLVADGVRAVSLPTGELRVRQAQLLQTRQPGDPARQALLVWQVYWVDGGWTSSDHAAKLSGAWQRLRGRGDDAAALIVYATESTDGAAAQTLEAFLRANLSTIEARLETARSRR